MSVREAVDAVRNACPWVRVHAWRDIPFKPTTWTDEAPDGGVCIKAAMPWRAPSGRLMHSVAWSSVSERDLREASCSREAAERILGNALAWAIGTAYGHARARAEYEAMEARG